MMTKGMVGAAVVGLFGWWAVDLCQAQRPTAPIQPGTGGKGTPMTPGTGTKTKKTSPGQKQGPKGGIGTTNPGGISTPNPGGISTLNPPNSNNSNITSYPGLTGYLGNGYSAYTALSAFNNPFANPFSFNSPFNPFANPFSFNTPFNNPWMMNNPMMFNPWMMNNPMMFNPWMM